MRRTAKGFKEAERKKGIKPSGMRGKRGIEG